MEKPRKFFGVLGSLMLAACALQGCGGGSDTPYESRPATDWQATAAPDTWTTTTGNLTSDSTQAAASTKSR